MTLTIYVNFLNHHQVMVMDELYKLFGNEFKFVATIPTNITLMKGGIDYSDRPYCIRSFESKAAYHFAEQLAISSDVCIFGNSSRPFAIIRAKKNPDAISFEMGERWLKRGLVNIFSPHFILWRWHYHKYFSKANFYRLCNSAFASSDLSKVRTYTHDRCFKWGYFTEVDCDYKVELSNQDISTSKITTLMWCARFLKLKHPELPVKLAARLKADGYKFVIDMYGSGVELESTRQLVSKLNVEDVVKLRGNLPNDQILQAMRKHNIFLFTSDKNEGWGAVANESMANGCVLVGSNEIGSVPYLVKDGENGMIFKSCDLNSLYQKIKFLLDNPQVQTRMSIAGYRTMKNVWSPANAAKNLLQLINDLQYNCDTSIIEGPCSRALII